MTAVTRPVRRKKPFPWKEALRILVLTLISLLMIFPIFWMISGSLKAPHEVMNKDVFWPAKPYWENYAIAWKSAPFGQYFKNSILMATTVVICQVLTGSLAGYAFAKLPFKLSKPIFFLFLCSMMIPQRGHHRQQLSHPGRASADQHLFLGDRRIAGEHVLSVPVPPVL